MKLSLNSPRMKKGLILLALAGVFGALGYYASPRQVRANVPADDGQKYAKQLKEAQAGKKALDAQIKELQDKLGAAAKQAEAAAAAVAAEKDKVVAAERFLTDLTVKLDQANHANEPMQQRMDLAEQQAAEARQWAWEAVGRTSFLEAESLALRNDRRELHLARVQLQQDNEKLTQFLTARTKALKDAQSLLGSLAFGGSCPAPAAAEGEMPITRRELIAGMGFPGVSTQRRDGQTEMGWGKGGKEHTAVLDGDVVARIDGQPAGRALLASVARNPLPTLPPSETWRFAPGDSPRYWELVSMFGQPDGVSGSATNFAASWAIGAWARQATVTVVDGVVTQVDGKAVDPVRLCELVRHRAAAYKTPSEATEGEIKTLRACHQEAMRVLQERISKEAAAAGKDGIRLTGWAAAAFDSPGTWAAMSSTGDLATIRAWVDCTWETSAHDRTTRRRYVVITLKTGAKPDVVEYAIFAPRG